MACGIVALALSALAPIARADAPPPYSGFLVFPAIHRPADPEDYSWTVDVGEDQRLILIDDQHAGIEYLNTGIFAMTIEAMPAHDVEGIAVPTTVSVSEGNIVTERVHHRAGNPAAEGGPFDYPIFAGPAFTVGEITVSVWIPSSTTPIPTPSPIPQPCRVPKLKGRTVKSSQQALHAANCALGKIHRRDSDGQSHAVIRQGTPPGTDLPAGSRVWITVGSR